MKNLRHELSKLNNLSSAKDIEIAFDSIAELLLDNCRIRKGASTYQILEIEFYFFNDNHPDKVAYPRTETSGRWFLHESGVDITFNSNEEQNFWEVSLSEALGRKIPRLAFLAPEIVYGNYLTMKLYRQIQFTPILNLILRLLAHRKLKRESGIM